MKSDAVAAGGSLGAMGEAAAAGEDDSPTRVAPEGRPAAPAGVRPADGPEVRQVGRYRIHDGLGRGGMATVFRAHDPSIGRDVAIKFLHASLSEEPEYRDRFLSEARAAGGLAHPNIVTVHDVGEIDGRPYMAMELLDGQTLSELLAAEPRQPVRDVVLMGMQLARALDYAHARGIVHRDIKPGNIMRVAGTMTVKVTDFGIAHIESPAGEQRTRVGDVLGTPQYMSPEQARGERLDGRSDLFSAGIVLYQMLAGERPFKGQGTVALAMQIANTEPTPLEKLRPDVPPSLRRVVARCLAKLPERRFASGKELADALAKVLAEVDAAELEKSRQRLMPLRVKWALMMGLVVAVIMGITGAVVTNRQYAAMISQATDHGAATARFIAAQNAVAALSEDWVAVEVAIQEMMKAGDFERITVIDREGMVRAASGSGVGQPYQPPPSKALGERKGGVAVTRFEAAGAEQVLGFEAPITFQDKQVGRVALGLPERPLLGVAQLSITLMVMLVLVTVLAVAVAMYFIADWFAKPIKLLGESMQEIAKGRFDHRIHETRKDEFGLLYTGFDQMAQALSERQGAAPMTAPLPSAAPPKSSVAASGSPHDPAV